MTGPRFDDEREAAFVALAVRCQLGEPDAVVNVFEWFGQWRASALYCGRIVEYVVGGVVPNLTLSERSVTHCPVCAEKIGTGGRVVADRISTDRGSVDASWTDGCDSCAEWDERCGEEAAE